MELMFRSVLEISLSMAAVVALLLLLRPLLQKRYRAKWMYWVWLLLAVRLVIPFHLTLPDAPVQVDQPAMTLFREESISAPALTWIQPADFAFVGGTKQLALGIEEDLYDRVITPLTPVLTLAQLSALVWGAGGCAVLLWEALSYARFRRRVRRWRGAEEDSEVLARFEELKGELGVKRLTMARCSAISSPMVTGFVHPTLLLPEAGAPDAVLRHELIHAKRHDLWYKLLLSFARAVHWFNPLVWVMSRQAEQDLELSCDETVVAHQSEDFRAEYGRAILAAVDSGEGKERAPLTSYFNGGKKAMLERLKSIVNTKAKRRGAVALTLAAALTLTVSAAVAVTPPTRRLDGGIYGVTIPGDVTVKLAEEMAEGFVTSYDEAAFYRGGSVGSVQRRSIPGFDTMSLEARAAALEVPGHLEISAYTSPGGIDGLAAKNSTTEYYYLSTGGNQVLQLYFYLGPKLDDFFEGRFTRAEIDVALASLRVGTYSSPAPKGGLTLTTDFTETDALWYLWGGTERAPKLLDTVSVPALRRVVTAPLWSPDGKWAVVPTSLVGSIRQDFQVLKVSAEGFGWSIDTSFSLGGNPATLFSSSGAPLDYAPIRETLELQVMEFVENPFPPGDLPAVRVCYSWLDTAGHLQSGSAVYPCFPPATSYRPTGFTHLTDVAQNTPCVPTVWQDGAHTLSLLLPHGTVVSGENQGVRTFADPGGAYLGRISKVAPSDAWNQAYEVNTRTHFYAWLDEADGLCYQLELGETNLPPFLANRMVEGLTMDGHAVAFYYENQIAKPTT